MKNIGTMQSGYEIILHGMNRRIKYTSGAQISQTSSIVP